MECQIASISERGQTIKLSQTNIYNFLRFISICLIFFFRFEHTGGLAGAPTHLTDEVNEEEDVDEDILIELSRKAAAGTISYGLIHV